MVRHRAFALLLVVCTAGAFGVACAHGEAPEGGIPGVDVVALGEKTSVLRGAPLPAGVDTVLLSRDEVAGILDAANAADWPGDEVERYAEALIAMGLWPADRELSVALLSVNADEVGGFYLHRDRHVYIVAEPRMS
jgi:hypothetical protein